MSLIVLASEKTLKTNFENANKLCRTSIRVHSLRNPRRILTELIKLALAAETYQATVTSYTSEELKECVRVASQGSIPGRAEALHLYYVQTGSESPVHIRSSLQSWKYIHSVYGWEMNRSPFPTQSRGRECIEHHAYRCFLVKPTALWYNQ
jgi:hypothetical protein